MTRRYSVEFTDEAWAAVDAHARHVAITLRAPLNASRWVRRLLSAVDGLTEMPTRFAVDERQSARGGSRVYRLNFERTCVLLYSVDESAGSVLIFSFWYGGHG